MAPSHVVIALSNTSVLKTTVHDELSVEAISVPEFDEEDEEESLVSYVNDLEVEQCWYFISLGTNQPSTTLLDITSEHSLAEVVISFIPGSGFWVGPDLSEEELIELIDNLPRGKAAGHDEIAHEAIIMAKDVLVPYLLLVFRACLRLSHHPKRFKFAKTILIRNEGKDAKLPGSWRPLAMLCCVGKLLEKIVSKKLTAFVTAHKLLPETQFGGRCTSKALQYLFNIVYDAWVRGEVVTLLGLDMKGAYDNVVQFKLLQTLVRKGIPEWIVDYIHSFLIDRTTTLEMPGLVSDAFDLFMGIPQGSPLSPILFNLFTCPLLEKPKRDLYPGVTLYTFAFVDDTYVIAVSSSYQENCNAIEAFHAEILSAAEPLGILFGPEKYHVMHFKAPWKRLKGEKLDLLPNIPGLKRKGEPCEEMKVLGVIVDYKLGWQKHVDFIRTKVRKRMNYLRRISGPTWGPSLSTMRMLYLTKIRPVITYACAAWFILDLDGPKFTWKMADKAIQDLESLQRECLRQISGAIKNTTGIVLEKELHIEIISVLLNRLATFHRAKELDSPECHQLRQMRTAHARHPFNRLEGPAAALYNDAEHTKEWRLHQADPHSSVGNETKRISIMRGLSKNNAREQCSIKWAEYLKERPLRHERERNKRGNQGWLRYSSHVPQALIEPWGGKSLKYYSNLSRAQSTMLLQCRTGFIGLKHHLCKINSADSPTCSCKRTYETVFHKLIQCSKLQEARLSLEREVGHTDFSKLLTTDGKVAAEWAITFFGIKQFDCLDFAEVGTCLREKHEAMEFDEMCNLVGGGDVIEFLASADVESLCGSPHDPGLVSYHWASSRPVALIATASLVAVAVDDEVIVIGREVGVGDGLRLKAGTLLLPPVIGKANVLEDQCGCKVEVDGKDLRKKASIPLLQRPTGPLVDAYKTPLSPLLASGRILFFPPSRLDAAAKFGRSPQPPQPKDGRNSFPDSPIALCLEPLALVTNMPSPLPRVYLVTLPTELRNHIYRLYFALDGGYVHNRDDPYNGKLTAANGKPIDFSLMYVCRLIAAETKDIPLQVNIVSFSTAYHPDWSLLAGRFEYLSSFYRQIEKDFVKDFGPWLTPETYSEIIQKFPQSESYFKFVMEPDLRIPYYRSLQMRQDIIGCFSFRRGGLSTEIDYKYRHDLHEFDELSCRFYEAVTYSLRLLRQKEPTKFNDYVAEDNNPGCFKPDEFDGLRFDPWAIPSPAELARVGGLLQDGEMWKSLQEWQFDPNLDEESRVSYRQAFRFSAAAVAIRFLDRLTPTHRLNLRKMVLHEDHFAIGRSECHALGLIPFCKENRQLRVERRVNLWRNILQEPQLPSFHELAEVEADVSKAERPCEILAQTILPSLSAWLGNADAVIDAGMPVGSFTFFLDGEPALDMSSELFQQEIHHKITWELAFRQCFGPSVKERLDSAIANIPLIRAMDHLVNQTSILRCNFNPGQLWDVDTIVGEHHDLPLEDWDKKWRNLEDSGGTRETCRLAPPLPSWSSMQLANFERKPKAKHWANWEYPDDKTE
ncbi:hypothetical protein NM208_g4093 [Fusarium decemcellulare]|uniref:Uncharacterized protein n=1 Tax=Fusarium decemcellulare TaxID=57161 RepID=A0ACC1SM25_9HYPO|nr:hypothetical protein NM208_g4093 [Fusarium decemcellulare]